MRNGIGSGLVERLAAFDLLHESRKDGFGEGLLEGLDGEHARAKDLARVSGTSVGLGPFDGALRCVDLRLASH